MKGETTGSTKFFSDKLKGLKATVRNRKAKKKKEEKDAADAAAGNLGSSGKKFSSNGSLVSQVNGVKSGVAGGSKGENLHVQLYQLEHNRHPFPFSKSSHI